MKAEALKAMTLVDLNKELEQARVSQLRLRFKRAAGEGLKTDEFKKLRQKIARILTVLREMRG